LYLGAGFEGVSHEGDKLVEHIIPTFPQVEEVLGEYLRYRKILLRQIHMNVQGAKAQDK
jgi:hypothetical protein